MTDKTDEYSNLIEEIDLCLELLRNLKMHLLQVLKDSTSKE
jgi:hypothetical protein